MQGEGATNPNCTGFFAGRKGCLQPGETSLALDASYAGMWGGMGQTCIIDGIAADCGVALGLERIGVAAQCPDNNCTGIRAEQGPGGSTLFKKWVPTQYGQVDTPFGPMFTVTTGYWKTLGVSTGPAFYDRMPDFFQAQVNVGGLVGASFGIAIDRNGHLYVGAGPEAGKSATAASVSLTLGWMTGGPPAKSTLTNFLMGWGCSAGGGHGSAAFFNWNKAGQAYSFGGATPQAGVGCIYSGKVF